MAALAACGYGPLCELNENIKNSVGKRGNYRTIRALTAPSHDPRSGKPLPLEGFHIPWWNATCGLRFADKLDDERCPKKPSKTQRECGRELSDRAILN